MNANMGLNPCRREPGKSSLRREIRAWNLDIACRLDNCFRSWNCIDVDRIGKRYRLKQRRDLVEIVRTFVEDLEAKVELGKGLKNRH